MSAAARDLSIGLVFAHGHNSAKAFVALPLRPACMPRQKFVLDALRRRHVSMAAELEPSGSLKRKQGLKSQKVLAVRGHEFLPASFKSPVQCSHCKIYIWFARRSARPVCPGRTAVLISGALWHCHPSPIPALTARQGHLGAGLSMPEVPLQLPPGLPAAAAAARLICRSAATT